MENIIRLSSVDSTNRYAKELAREGAAHKTLVMADEQTQGRGRRGRGWISPAGEGIFMSLILRPDMPPEQVPMISLHTAVAVCLAISRVTGLEAKIKWPNDIVLGGRKVCGMLLEMDADAQQVRSVVAGIGINVHQTQFPQEIAHTASSLDLLCGRRLSRMDVVRAFLAAFDEVEAMGKADGGRFMDAYRGSSATIGQQVQVISLTGTYTGTALDVTESGSLIVLDGEGQRREVLAADVSVRGLMGYA